MTQRPNFRKAKSLATQLLYSQSKKTDLKTNIESLAFDKNIKFVTIQDFCDKTKNSILCFQCSDNNLPDGMCQYIEKTDTYVVLYNQSLFPHRKKWTIAHELGHIYLGHTEDNDIAEIEAHFFAAQLLMPEQVVLYLKDLNDGDITAEKLVELFDVSFESATKRINTIKKAPTNFVLSDHILLPKYKDLLCAM